jgi:hypothetical protein
MIATIYARKGHRAEEGTLMGTIYRPKFCDRHGLIQESGSSLPVTALLE